MQTSAYDRYIAAEADVEIAIQNRASRATVERLLAEQNALASAAGERQHRLEERDGRLRVV